MILDLSATDALGVQGDDLVLDPGDRLLPLPYDQGLETAVSVPRHRERQVAILASDALVGVAVAPIARTCGQARFTIVLLVAQVVVELAFQHRLQRTGKQLLQGRLDVFHRLGFTLAQELLYACLGETATVLAEHLLCHLANRPFCPSIAGPHGQERAHFILQTL